MFKWLRKKKQKHSANPDQQQQPLLTRSPEPSGSPAPATSPVENSVQQQLHDSDEYPQSVEDREDLKNLKLLLSRFPIWCAGCSKTIILRAEDVSRSVRMWWEERTPNTAAAVRAELVCGLYCGRSGCGAVTCLCGSRVSAGSSSELPQALVSGKTRVHINHCCNQGRNLVLWALACAKSQFKLSSSQWILSARPHESDSSNTAPGTGYANNNRTLSQLFHLRHRNPPTPTKASQSSRTQDLATATLELRFRLVASLLPLLRGQDDSNMGLVAFMLARSDLLNWAADLLVNDSVQDIQKHFYLYDGLLDFIQSLARHPATNRLMTQERRIFSDEGKLIRLSFIPSKDISSKANAVDTGKSLGSMLAKIAPRSEKMLRYDKKYKFDTEEADDANMRSWNRRLILIAKSYQDPKPAAELPVAATGTVPSFAEYHRLNALAEVSDSEILSSHYFKKEADKIAISVLARKRMKRVVRENTILQTSLPEGIFVRHGSSRLDVMKVLIIGPQGTPYADGFFMFDIFLPADFPQKPPSVRFRVTSTKGNGMNPNLYTDGTVCLSLLGTWSGEPWRPEQSTLLQVLVSIQSMIFCPEPYYNEPYRSKNDVESRKYNKLVQQMTLDYAIDPWIQGTANAYGSRLSAAFAKQRAEGSVGARIQNFHPLWREVAVRYYGKDSKYRTQLSRREGA
ncbi:hypothetical protein PG985_014656 [Apiospora marii]|uniref:uncharacterized protein n=1 Tax=Apiospora marii TaxID=335849 RepID=UPI00312FFA67